MQWMKRSAQVESMQHSLATPVPATRSAPLRFPPYLNITSIPSVVLEENTSRNQAWKCQLEPAAYWNVIEIPSEKLDVAFGFLSRNQHWKRQVSPGSTSAAPWAQALPRRRCCLG